MVLLVYTLLGPAHLLFFDPARAAENAPEPTGFASIVAKVKPAVIAVTVRLEETAQSEASNQQEAEQLHHYFYGSPDGQANPPVHHIMTALGSGFFISSDGYAVTNYHVVEHGQSFKIATDDGKSYTAKVVGADLRTDLALLKVDGRDDFPYVKFADHEPQIGDWVVAVGNPYGLGGTVTAGIVSARGRHIGVDNYVNFIQIDAPINKGNSGGPSFDVAGNVVGVNTAIFSTSGGSMGIGFAIPASTAKAVVQELKEKGVVTRGSLGVEIEAITPDIVEALGLKKVAGAIVAEPQPNSPAEKAGIKPGDVVTSVNGESVKDPSDLAIKIGGTAPGTRVAIGIYRKGHEETFSVALGELPSTPFKPAASPNAREPSGLGLSLSPARNIAGAGDKGVVITGVDPSGRGAETGLAVGDVILDVAGNLVSTPADVRNALAEVRNDAKRSVLMRVKSDDRVEFVAVPLAAPHESLWGKVRNWFHSL